jgi:23S rRNA pseudouridine1911/1915/1917 synthase
MGYPVVGDPVYGFKKQKIKTDGQLLHAHKLSLTHPSTGERMTFTAPLPTVFQEILEKLYAKYGVKKEETLFAPSTIIRE